MIHSLMKPTLGYFFFKSYTTPKYISQNALIYVLVKLGTIVSNILWIMLTTFMLNVLVSSLPTHRWFHLKYFKELLIHSFKLNTKICDVFSIFGSLSIRRRKKNIHRKWFIVWLTISDKKKFTHNFNSVVEHAKNQTKAPFP